MHVVVTEGLVFVCSRIDHSRSCGVPVGVPHHIGGEMGVCGWGWGGGGGVVQLV